MPRVNTNFISAPGYDDNHRYINLADTKSYPSRRAVAEAQEELKKYFSAKENKWLDHYHQATRADKDRADKLKRWFDVAKILRNVPAQREEEFAVNVSLALGKTNAPANHSDQSVDRPGPSNKNDPKPQRKQNNRQRPASADRSNPRPQAPAQGGASNSDNRGRAPNREGQQQRSSSVNSAGSSRRRRRDSSSERGKKFNSDFKRPEITDDTVLYNTLFRLENNPVNYKGELSNIKHFPKLIPELEQSYKTAQSKPLHKFDPDVRYESIFDPYTPHPIVSVYTPDRPIRREVNSNARGAVDRQVLLALTAQTLSTNEWSLPIFALNHLRTHFDPSVDYFTPYCYPTSIGDLVSRATPFFAKEGGIYTSGIIYERALSSDKVKAAIDPFVGDNGIIYAGIHKLKNHGLRHLTQ